MIAHYFQDEEPEEITVLELLEEAVEEFGLEFLAVLPLDACTAFLETGSMPDWVWVGGCSEDRVQIFIPQAASSCDRYRTIYEYLFTYFVYPINWSVQLKVESI